MIVDMHVHTHWKSAESRPAKNMQILIESAKKNCVDKLIILGSASWPYSVPCALRDVQDSNNTTMLTMSEFPDMCFGGCFLDPNNPVSFMQEETERCIVEGGMVCIKLHANINARSELLDPIMMRAEELDVPVVHHAWYKSTPQLSVESTPNDIAHLARRHPAVKIVMCHLTGCGARGVQDIKQYPNVYVDTSGGQPETVITEYAVEQLGVERILYGSDANGRDYVAQLARIFGAQISNEDKRKILGENAMRLFKLTDRAMKRGGCIVV